MPNNTNDETLEFFMALDRAAKALSAEKVNNVNPKSRVANMKEAPKSFKEIEKVIFEHNYGGRRAFLMFPNGYGASIINTSFSYGSDEAPWELAVMTEDGICYETPITDDVVGHCTEVDIIRICGEIFNLPTKN